MENNVICEKAGMRKCFAGLLGFMGLYMLLQTAGATGGEEEFGDIYTQITEWSQGTLGKLLVLICVVVVMAYTISRGTLIYAVIGIAICLVLYNAPTIIDNLMDAALPAEQAISTAAVQISNGLL